MSAEILIAASGVLLVVAAVLKLRDLNRAIAKACAAAGHRPRWQWETTCGGGAPGVVFSCDCGQVELHGAEIDAYQIGQDWRAVFGRQA